AGVSDPGPDDIHAVGTLGMVIQLLRLPDGTVKALLEGKKRARVVRYASQGEFFQVEVEEIEEFCDHTTEVEALMRAVNATLDNYVRVTAKISPETATSIASVDDPAYLADKLVGHLGIKPEDKQSLLECTNPAERLERILGYMRSELEILEVNAVHNRIPRCESLGSIVEWPHIVDGLILGVMNDLVYQVSSAGNLTLLCVSFARLGALRVLILRPSPCLHRIASRKGDPVH